MSTQNESDHKFIIALWHGANRGKTESLRSLAKLLLSKYSPEIIHFNQDVPVPDKNDFIIVLKINDTVIGITSQGDPKTNLWDRLKELLEKYGCHLVFCSTRTRGETVGAVNHMAGENDCHILWTSTYQTTIDDKDHRQMLNDLKAGHLVELAQSLGFSL